MQKIIIITSDGAPLNDFWNSALADSGFQIDYASFKIELEFAAAQDVAAFLLDASQNVDGAFDTLQDLTKYRPNIPIIAIMARSDLSRHGAKWHREGACNFLRLDATKTEIQITLNNEIDVSKYSRRVRHPQKTSEKSRPIIGDWFLDRGTFFSRARQEFGRSRHYNRSLACIMIGVNYYQHYLNAFGEPCMDYLLHEVARAVYLNTSESDIIARFDAGKIVVLLPETDVYGAAVIREHVIEMLAQRTFEWEGNEIPLDVSIGESERAPSANAGILLQEELACLLEDADNALKVAQRAALRPEIFMEYEEIPLP